VALPHAAVPLLRPGHGGWAAARWSATTTTATPAARCSPVTLSGDGSIGRSSCCFCARVETGELEMQGCRWSLAEGSPYK